MKKNYGYQSETLPLPMRYTKKIVLRKKMASTFWKVGAHKTSSDHVRMGVKKGGSQVSNFLYLVRIFFCES